MSKDMGVKTEATLMGFVEEELFSISGTTRSSAPTGFTPPP